MKSMILFTFAIVAFASHEASKASYLPRYVAPDDQNKIIETLGFGSSSKISGNPYPLGGNEGLEISLSSEHIPNQALKDIGQVPADTSELKYVTLNLGKGLFYDVDTYLSFSILQESNSLAVYGGHIRWCFYRFESLPISLSTAFHGSGGNFENLLYTRTLGLALYANYHFKALNVYAGWGQSRSIATLRGGTPLPADPSAINSEAPISESGDEITLEKYSPQATMGFSLSLNQYFVGAEATRFINTAYAIKIGTRY